MCRFLKWRVVMKTTEIITAVKILESLPRDSQKKVVDHLQDYIANLKDELYWDQQFENSGEQLAVAARDARERYHAGEAKPMDLSRF